MFLRFSFAASLILFLAPFSSEASFPFFISNLHFDITVKNSSDRERITDAKNLKGESIIPLDLSTSEIKSSMLWSQLDPESDHIEGTSTQKAYDAYPELSFPNQNEVIVAVIDGGVDIHHEDLKGKIWVNPDVNHDGYANAVNGWNFIGDLDGSGLESTREIARLMKKQKQTALSAEDSEYLSRLKADYDSRRQDTDLTIKKFTAFAEAYENNDTEHIALLEDAGLNQASVQTILETKKKELTYSFNFEFDSSSVIHDHPEVLDEKGYGNNDVIGPNPKHGTHVAGIIAADRLNKIGILGQAQNVKIMPLRVVPDGDERDKDVGNAIRFAVDHHARIINMSFGKSFSPQKEYVDKAVSYAEAHNVLIVHSAGNDGENTDSFTQSFPNKKLKTSTPHFASNWIEVGASTPYAAFDPTTGDSLPADFSNFGKLAVDLFAPGIHIYSTVPGNRYASLQGTSMAAPEVSGIAALLLQLDPELSAQKLKSILMETVTHYDGLGSIEPGSLKNIAPRGKPAQWDGTHVPFSNLSVSGGIVNAYRAIELLESQNKHLREQCTLPDAP